MSEALFDEVPHRCTGEYCRACSVLRGERGMQQALVSKHDWQQRAQLWFDLLERGALFTSEDLTEAVGLPTGSTGLNKNNAVGAFLRNLSKMGAIVKKGSKGSRKKRSHGASIALWKKL